MGTAELRVHIWPHASLRWNFITHKQWIWKYRIYPSDACAPHMEERASDTVVVSAPCWSCPHRFCCCSSSSYSFPRRYDRNRQGTQKHPPDLPRIIEKTSFYGGSRLIEWWPLYSCFMNMEKLFETQGSWTDPDDDKRSCLPILCRVESHTENIIAYTQRVFVLRFNAHQSIVRKFPGRQMADCNLCAILGSFVSVMYTICYKFFNESMNETMLKYVKF